MKAKKLTLGLLGGALLLTGGAFLGKGWLIPSSNARSVVAQRSAAIGQPAPDFTLLDTYNKKHSLSQYKGKFVVLEWLNHGCPFVKKHYDSGNMQKLQRKFTKKGVVWLSIVSSAPGRQGYHKPKQANALTQKKKAAPSALLRDPKGTVGRMYRAKTTPHMYIISPTGTLLYQGAIDSVRSTDPDDVKNAKNYVSMALKEAMANKKVTISKTRPYGCSVKYSN